MMRTLLTSSLLAILVMSATAEEPAVRVVEASMKHGGRTRTYRLLVRSDHDKAKPVPLVLALHGGGGTAEGFDRATNDQFAREVKKRGWVVAFPQGVAKGWNDGRPLTSLRDRQRRGVDDVAFLGALIDHLKTTHGIDTTRVYSTGISNGGFMSYRLGLELSGKIAAVAPVAANLAKVHDGKRPGHPVGLLVINGTEDPLVPYAGGYVRVFGRRRGAIFSTDETMKRWAAFLGCETQPRTVAMADIAPKDGARPYASVWPGCKGAEVRLIRVQGGGHTWPGGRPYLPAVLVGRVCRDFDAVPVIFDFFSRHRRGAAKTHSTGLADAGFESGGVATSPLHGWACSQASNGVVRAQADEAHRVEGKCSLRVDMLMTLSGVTVTLDQTVDLPAAGTFELSMRVRTEDVPWVRVRVGHWTAANRFVELASTSAEGPDGEWQTATLRFAPPRGERRVGIFLSAPGMKGAHLWLDDAKLVRVR